MGSRLGPLDDLLDAPQTTVDETRDSLDADALFARIAARIEKEVNGEVKTHRLIRADTLESHGAAVEASVGKAKLLIDQLGDRLFD